MERRMRKLVLLLILVLFLFIPVFGIDTVDKIVYESDGIIYLINSDGTNEVRLTEGYHPMWSPDGQKILYFSKEDFRGPNTGDSYGVNVNIINADGSGKLTILKDIGLPSNDEVKYTRNGRIVFSYFRVCKDADCEVLGNATDDEDKIDEGRDEYYWQATTHIGSISDTGQDFLHLTKTSDIFFVGDPTEAYANHQGCSLGWYPYPDAYCYAHETNPIVSPNGDRIVYISVDKSIKIQNADGSNRNIILKKEDIPVDPRSSYYRIKLIEWSPDAESLLYSIETPPNTYLIYRVSINGTGLMRLTEGASPKWSPDGRYIAFINQGIWVMNGDGTGQKKISRSGLDSLDWSPDSNKIVTDGLVIANFTGNEVKLGNGRWNDPRWSPALKKEASSLNVFGNSGSSSKNSMQSPGFDGLITVTGLFILIILCIFFREK